MLTALIESEVRFPGRSISGIEAWIPEALGSFSLTLDSIFDETVFSAAIAAVLKRTKIDEVAINARFLDFMGGKVLKQTE
jgi:hypothetical protein